MVLGDAEETITTIEFDEETYEEVYKNYQAKHSNAVCTWGRSDPCVTTSENRFMTIS